MRAIAVPEPLMVAEKLADLEPTVTMIETFPPETVPVTRSGLVGTGAYMYLAAIARIS